MNLLHDLVREPAPTPGPQSSACRVAGDIPALTGRRILIAEDVATNQMLLTAVLAPTTYQLPRYSFDACRVFTNKPPCGPKRGHGTPQPRFGQEVQLDKIAEKLQMDPAELESICMPVVEDDIDYVKGNRLIHQSSWFVIPKTRYFGNSILSILTKIASGYWHVSDTQTGYTAISKKAINAIKLYDIYKRYGMPNDMLVKLNIAFCTLKEIEIKPVYNVGEKSKMKVTKVVFPIMWLLFKSFFRRMWIKYLFRDFHPLFLLYHMGIFLLLAAIPFLIDILLNAFQIGAATPFQTMIIFIFLVISGSQSLFFAMWMDIQDNERLYK